MKFEIIPDQQTPAVPEVGLCEAKYYIEEHHDDLVEFLEFARRQTTAVGLAANQCSKDDERFMVRAFALLDLKTAKWSLIIDPRITKYIGIKEVKPEGCLTWKNRKIMAERSRGVMVEYFNMDGKKITNEFHYGFDGQIWQHEINHLNGVEEDVVEYNHPEPIPARIRRNEPCPCGSGKKYKKCCLILI